MVASLLCAVHCGATALLASASAVLENPRIELPLVGVSIVIAAITLVSGYRQHRSITPALVGIVAILLLVLAKTLHIEMFEAIGSVIGGLALASAHWLNLRAGKKCALGCHP